MAHDSYSYYSGISPMITCLPYNKYPNMGNDILAMNWCRQRTHADSEGLCPDRTCITPRQLIKPFDGIVSPG